MKVTSATIHLVLRLNKTLSDGTNPIVIRVQWNGRKDKATGYSCLPKQWDSNNECLKRGTPNATAINQTLNALKQSVVARKLEYEGNGIEYTAAMLFEERKVVDKSFRGIMNAMAKERALKANTMRTYNHIYNQLKSYIGHDFDIIEIDEKIIRGYVNERLKAGIAKGTMRLYMQMFYSIWHYAYKNNLVSFDMSDRYEYWDELPIANNKRALTAKEITRIYQWLMYSTSVKVDEGYLRDNITCKRCLMHTSREFAVNVFLLGFLFQGMALVDLAKVRRDRLEIKEYGGERYYYYRTERSKTGEPVEVIIPIDKKSHQLMDIFLERKTDSNYFLPILDGIDIKDEVKVNNRLTYYTTFINKNLKSVCKDIDKENKEKDKDAVSFPMVNYYSCRHSFASIYASNGGNLISLANMMGRSVDHISTYIKDLNGVEDMIESRKLVFEG